MQELEREPAKLKWWPSPQDYNEAVQMPTTSFSDPELQNAALYVDSLGLPKAACGSFASVYRVRTERQDYAVRLFLRNVTEQEERYALISEFVQQDDLPYTVNFDYQRSGIVTNASTFPLLKMDWVSGLNLDIYVGLNYSDGDKMSALAEKYLQMSQDLRRNGIAHGDLQHGNVIVCDNELRLVDYDGMYVPSMANFSAMELGHRNYQHPDRDASTFGAYLDNFSDWVIYVSLRALAIDPSLFQKLNAGDECLLFKRADFVRPYESNVFRTLEHHESEEIRRLSRFLRAQLGVPVRSVHELCPNPPDVDLEVLPSDLIQPAEPRKTAPAWLRDAELLVEGELEAHSVPATLRSRGGSFVRAQSTFSVQPAQSASPGSFASVRQRAAAMVLPADLSVYEPELRCQTRYIPPEADSVGGRIWLAVLAIPCLGIMFGLVAAFVAAFAVLVLMAAFTETKRKTRELVQSGGLAKTIAVRPYIVDSKHYVSYGFETHDGVKIESQAKISKKEYEDLQRNPRPLTVIYRFFAPEDSVLYEFCGIKAVKS